MIVVETANSARALRLWSSEGKQVSMVRQIVAVCCLVSVWGCAHPSVQPDTQERSAIAFAQKLLKEMSQGLEKLRVCMGRFA